MKTEVGILFALALVASMPIVASAADEAAGAEQQTFDLHIVGPDGKGVPRANVEIRTQPAPSAEQVQRGKFVKQVNYGAFLKADAEGRLTVTIPAAPKAFDVYI